MSRRSFNLVVYAYQYFLEILNAKMHLAGQIMSDMSSLQSELLRIIKLSTFLAMEFTDSDILQPSYNASFSMSSYAPPTFPSLRHFVFPPQKMKKQPAWQDQKDEQMLRIRSQIGYQHDPNLEKMQKKLRQTPCLVGFFSKANEEFLGK